MRPILFYIILVIVTCGCESFADTIRPLTNLSYQKKGRLFVNKDTSALPKQYSGLVYEKVELLSSAPGTKSVLFNSAGSKLYAMNLEGMSVYEFDQPTRKIIREFKFKPTKGIGWDYVKDKPIPSYEEKPVEACLTHNDKILWISLHNAGGIVPVWIDSIGAYSKPVNNRAIKHISIIYPGNNKKVSFNAPLIRTGKTPKVIAKTADSKYLLVSNWHSYDVSVLKLNKAKYPFGKVISTIRVAAIPRGIAVDDKTGKSYVAIMGGASIAVINNDAWVKEDNINVASNPRHIVMDTNGHLFVSYNSLAQIACIDAASGKTLFTEETHSKPRTIILSKNYKFLFVTCYTADTLDVFKINDTNFEKITSLPCKGHPVGVDIFENDDKLEAWVCSYSNGSISVFSFRKKN